uniref:Uncharacterized protein n=1 Tax=Rhizophora mucronata TaxID=61149 RepID=A0A2P2JP84_RHIMU
MVVRGGGGEELGRCFVLL